MLFGIDRGFYYIYETFCSSAKLNNNQNGNKRRAWKEKNVEKEENNLNLYISALPAGELLTGNIKSGLKYIEIIFDLNVCF